MDAVHDTAVWADAVSEAYAAEAKPPLTQELVGQVRAALVDALGPAADAASPAGIVDRLNAVLDSFEVELGAVVGPRIASFDEAAGSVLMRHRSEAGQPLRAFGGQ